MKYVLPDYRNSIVNMASSIAHRIGVNSNYKPLKELDLLKNYKTVIYLIIDGLGYEYLKNTDSFLKTKIVRSMTSVFPSATTAAIISIQNAEAPQQHASVGWFINLKEFGAVSIPLRFMPRFGNAKFTDFGAKRDMIFTGKSILEKSNMNSILITSNEIRPKNKLKGKKKVLVYKKGNMKDLFKNIKKAVEFKKEKLIYAYTGIFDSSCHHHGCNSNETTKVFKELDSLIETFSKLLDNNTILVVSADHGLIDTPKIIDLKKHEKLYDMLSMPLCGDLREVYCYVKVSKAKAFEEYVKKYLAHVCFIYKSEELIKRGFFGLGIPNKKLFDRIGDYTLICKDNYVIEDNLIHQPAEHNIANHGGLTKEEMLVPLIIIKN